MTTKSPARAVHAAFWRVPDDARRTIGASLLADHEHPVMFELGRALGSGPVMSELLVDYALDQVRWDPGALALADRLGGDEPWRTLAGAIRTTVANRDNQHPEVVVVPDESPPVDGVGGAQ